MKKKIIVLLLIAGSQASRGQTHTETLTREVNFEKNSPSNTLMIFNINGSVTVTGHNGTSVRILVEKIIRGKTASHLELGKREVSLGIIDRADSLICYIKGILPFGRNIGRHAWGEAAGWGYDWNTVNQEPPYDHVMNFTVEVPAHTHVRVQAINEGDVAVSDVLGSVHALHVNGPITLRQVSGEIIARTINGDVNLDYDTNPTSRGQYYTLNGDIHANFRKNLAADLTFSSFQGEMYSNIDRWESLPGKLEKNELHKGIKYKVGASRFRIGAGGVPLNFETFNGDVFVKER